MIRQLATTRTLKRANGYVNIYLGPMKGIASKPVLEHIREDTYTALAKAVLKRGVPKAWSIRKLFTTQTGVEDVVFKPKESHVPFGKRPILVVVINGLPVVLDGNHRIAIEWLAGADSIEAKTLDIGKVKVPTEYNSILRLNRTLRTRSDGV